MSHWIEEAEKRQQEKDKTFVHSAQEGGKIINDNHENISIFIKNLTNLIDRVAKLSPEERKPSIELGSTHLEGDLKYEFFGSAFQIHQKRIAFIFKKTKHYLYWHRLYINITNTPNLIKVTLYEKGTSDLNQKDVIKKKMKFLIKIDSLQPSLTYHIVDWLVYKTSLHDLKQHLPTIK